MKRIEILYFDSCPGWRATVDRVREVVAEGDLSAGVEIRLVPVETDEAARALRFLGSPTVRIDGVDLDPNAEKLTSFGLQCRIYDNGGHLEGVPSVNMIRAGLGLAVEADSVVASTGSCCGCKSSG